MIQARSAGFSCVRTPKPVTRTFISCDVGGDVGSIAGSTTIPTSPMVITQVEVNECSGQKETQITL